MCNVLIVAYCRYNHPHNTFSIFIIENTQVYKHHKTTLMSINLCGNKEDFELN